MQSLLALLSRLYPLSLLVAACLALPAGATNAGGIAPCESPFIFDGAAANIVPIEYLATAADNELGDSDRRLRIQATAQRLAWLMKLDTWHQPTYGSLGVVAHMFLGQVCDPDEVLGGLLQGRAAGPIRPGQILIMLQGRIFIEGETIFLQTRLRGFRRNESPYAGDVPLSSHFMREGIQFSFGDGSRWLAAGLPLVDITFAPRAMTMAEFDEIDSVFADASRIHQDASASSSSEPLVFEPGVTRAFQIELIDGGEWIKVDDMFGGVSGYIHSDPEVSTFLHRKLPELDFVNGLLGYLRLRQISGVGDFFPPPESTAARGSDGLRRFVEAAPAEDKEARALASALLAALTLQSGNNWAEVRRLLVNVTEIAPYSSEYRNMLGVADARLCCTGDSSGEFGDPAADFADSLSLAPDNTEALTNLDRFLSIVSDLDARGAVPTGVDASRLAERREVVAKVISATEPP